jgi:hypothetical protein
MFSSDLNGPNQLQPFSAINGNVSLKAQRIFVETKLPKPIPQIQTNPSNHKQGLRENNNRQNNTFYPGQNYGHNLNVPPPRPAMFGNGFGAVSGISQRTPAPHRLTRRTLRNALITPLPPSLRYQRHTNTTPATVPRVTKPVFVNTQHGYQQVDNSTIVTNRVDRTSGITFPNIFNRTFIEGRESDTGDESREEQTPTQVQHCCGVYSTSYPKP